jgi:hypothetical protein
MILEHKRKPKKEDKDKKPEKEKSGGRYPEDAPDYDIKNKYPDDTRIRGY